MRVKLRDVATRANVSVATVSRVLNNYPNVDSTTRHQVLRVLSELGYPMMEARSQSAPADIRTIIVATDGLSDGAQTEDEEVHTPANFIHVIINGIELVARRSGIRMNILRTHMADPSPEDLTHFTEGDGVIIIGGVISPVLISALEEAHIPFVQAAAHAGKHEINCVLGDYLQGATEAITALAELGHRRIAMINGPSTTMTSMDKLSGYKLGLCEAGLAFDPNLVVPARYFDAQDGYQATQTLLQRTRGITAILYASDSLAIGGIRALSEAGLEVPASISVVGFYNEPITQFTIPSLSSIHVNWQRIGIIAAQRLLTLLEPEQSDEERLRIVLPMHVVLRDSIGPALHHENQI